MPKQIYVLVGAAAVLGVLLYEVQRRSELDRAQMEQSLLEAELILGIPQIPDLLGWPESMRAELSRLHEGLELGATQVESLQDLGRFYFINGFMGQARQCFGALRNIEPKNPQWPYFLGLATNDFQDKAIAVEAFEASIASDEGYANARYWLGRALMDSGDLPGARRAFETLLHDKEWEAWARYGIAEGLSLEERFEEGLAELDRAIELDSSIRSFHALKDEIAALAGDRERREEAQTAYLRLPFEVEPFDPWEQSLWPLCYDAFRLLQLARAQQREENWEVATTMLERAAEMDPGNDFIIEALQSIEVEIGRR